MCYIIIITINFRYILRWNSEGVGQFEAIESNYFRIIIIAVVIERVDCPERVESQGDAGEVERFPSSRRLIGDNLKSVQRSNSTIMIRSK